MKNKTYGVSIGFIFLCALAPLWRIVLCHSNIKNNIYSQLLTLRKYFCAIQSCSMVLF